MKKLKIIIFIIFILVAILISLLTIVNNKKDNKQESFNNGGVPSREYKLDLRMEDNKKRYYGIENIIKNYFAYLNEENLSLGDKVTVEDYICYILNDSYIKENNIAKDNVWEYVRPFGKNKEPIINEMYVRETSDYFVEYVQVTLYDKDQLNYKNKYNFNYNFDKIDVYYRVDVDSIHSTYRMQPIEKSEFDSRSKAEDTKISIEKNEYNSINFATSLTDAAMSMKYLSNYKEKMRYDIESAYEVLDQQYREKRFGSLDEYKRYVLENKDWLDFVTVDKYQSNYKEDYKEYVCLDKKGNYYIFKETGIMKYTLELDTYTLERQKFITEYNKSKEQDKVMMNIDKFINMINNKDYKNLYSLLADSFKNNYFKTEESFKEYVKNNFFEYNEETYTYYEKENDVHSYEIQIKDKSGKDNKTITKKIIMQLKEGTDFIMAFNLE